ncbi:MAG: type VI secretion IcmF C-terminal domain-containing protein, partial [Caldimonas sp.]
TPGVRISAITNDGRAVEILNEPGNFAVTRMGAAAKTRQLQPNLYEMSWSQGGSTVTVQLRMISMPGAAPAPRAAGVAAPVTTAGLRGAKLPAVVVGLEPQAPVPSPAAAASGARS